MWEQPRRELTLQPRHREGSALHRRDRHRLGPPLESDRTHAGLARRLRPGTKIHLVHGVPRG